MADTLTAIHEFVKPQVGGSAGSWGGKLNAGEDSVDNLLAFPRIQRQTLSDGSVTMVVSAGTVAKIALTQATTIAFSGFAADTTPFKPSQRVLIQLTGNGTHDATFTGVTWLSGITPVFTLAQVYYIEVFTVDNGTNKYGVVHDRIHALQVATAMLQDDAVTTAKILNANVTTAKLADDAATSDKIAAAYPRRAEIHLTSNMSLPQNVDTQIVWTGPVSAYNVGSFVLSTTGIQVPAGDFDDHYLELTAQVSLQDGGDPSDDDSAIFKVWIEDGSGNILGEQWVGTDAQNGNALGWRVQVRAYVNDPGGSVVYRVKVRSYLGAGTRNILADKTWFVAVLH